MDGHWTCPRAHRSCQQRLIFGELNKKNVNFDAGTYCDGNIRTVQCMVSC